MVIVDIEDVTEHFDHALINLKTQQLTAVSNNACVDLYSISDYVCICLSGGVYYHPTH